VDDDQMTSIDDRKMCGVFMDIEMEQLVRMEGTTTGGDNDDNDHDK
jgi:hypothetical protein